MTNDAPKNWIILIIDDDPDFCLLLQTKLPKTFQVVIADSGEEGLEEAGKRNHDAIILDVMMPGIHGFHALERLRRAPNTKNTPILVTSNMPQDQVEPQATEAGAGYLNKQTPIKDIVARILKEVGAG